MRYAAGLPNLLHPSLRNGADEFARQFGAAEPFRHVVIDRFLDPDFCQDLIREFPGFDAKYAFNERGELGGKAAIPNIARLGPAYRRFDGLMRDRAFLDLMGHIAGIDALLYDPDYVGGGTHENRAGQELDLHIDFNYHPRTFRHRRLNLIVFLNPEWNPAWGGCLELRKDPWSPANGEMKLIVPLANRAVLFETSERSWHGFTRIELPEEKRGLSRRSLAVYFYTRKRPANETAPAHATVYIPRPIPDYVKPGYTLRQEDVDLLRKLIERRNMQIHFLYEREKEVNAMLTRITRSPSFMLSRLLTWPARKLRD